LLRYAPENRSSPRVLTGKWLLQNSKLTARLKNKTGTNPQTKDHKHSHELRLIRQQTQHKNPEQMYLKFLTPLTSSVEKTEYLWVQISLYIKKYKCIIYSMRIIMAWQCISPEVILKGFKKCCISNAMDGTEDYMLRNDSEEDGNVRSECEEHESTDCEDGDSDSVCYR
jgi:hypothetical protein